tara:strand:- start:566 stop:925 length:360 start_codon:yes stop_codon:yes gene_type:complete
MTQFTDSQEKSATIASVSKSTIGTISVPKGRRFDIFNLWFGSAQKGVGIIEVDIFPSMQGRYVFNTDSAIEVAGESMGWPVSISCPGPCSITLSTEQAAATSNTVRAMVNYVDTTLGGV